MIFSRWKHLGHGCLSLSYRGLSHGAILLTDPFFFERELHSLALRNAVSLPADILELLESLPHSSSRISNTAARSAPRRC
ncbi:hypothetical protein BDV11DRAFT_189449 [Aspergillus similis]